jgi:hypothetical protein
MEACNNLEVVAPDGKTWFLAVLSQKEGVVCDSHCVCLFHKMDAMALMLFGVMVDGYAFAFETAQVRDLFVEAVNTHTPMSRPACALCPSVCDNEYGNNPFPLAPSDKRCCDRCGAEKVIPHRLKEEAKKMEMKKNTIEKIKDAIARQVVEYCAGNGFDPSCFTLVSAVDSPAMYVVVQKFNKTTDLSNAFVTHAVIEVENLLDELFEAADLQRDADFDGFYNKETGYTAERLKRKENCDEKLVAIGYAASCNMFPLYDEMNLLHLQYHALERKIIDDFGNALVAETPDTTDSEHSSNSSNSKKAKKLGAKQAQTRNANKTKQAAIEERKAFERKEAECAKYRADQERKAKQAKLLKKQKKEKEQEKLNTAV